MRKSAVRAWVLGLVALAAACGKTTGPEGHPGFGSDGSGLPVAPDGGVSSGPDAGGIVAVPVDAGTPARPDAGVGSGPDADGEPDGGGEVACVVPAAPPFDDRAPWTYPPLQPCLPTYELWMTDAQLENFLQDLYAPEISARFVAGGVSYTGMVRLRGASSRTFPKKSWNVDLGEGRFDGRRRFNLVAEYQDQTLLVEKWAYDVLAAMGVPAPRATYVRLKVNGRYEGVFLDLEQVDKVFVKARSSFLDPDPNIYRCGWKDCELKTWKVGYQGDWTKKTNEDEPGTDVAELMEVFNHTAEPDFPRVVAEQFELESYLRAMAMDVLVSNNYVEDSESYLIHDRWLRKWSYVPWDLNNADPRWWYGYPLDSVDHPYFNHPLFPFTLVDAVVESRYANRSTLYEGYLPVFSNLATRVVFNPELRALLEALIARGQDELLAEVVAAPRIGAMYALIAPHMLGPDPGHTDPYFDLEKFALGPEYVRRFVTRRNLFIDAELQRLRQPAPLRLTTVSPVEGWVEVQNVSSAPLELAGKTLTNDLRQALLANLPEQTLLPGEVARFDMATLGVPLAASGEVGLFDGARMTGVYDLLFYGPGSGGQNLHVRDDQGHWQVR